MYNPTVNPVSISGLQTVNVYDSDTKTRRNITTTHEAVDKFISSRNETLKKANVASGVVTAASALGMVALGHRAGSTGLFSTIVNGFFGGVIGSMVGQCAIVNPANKKSTQEFINQNV